MKHHQALLLSAVIAMGTCGLAQSAPTQVAAAAKETVPAPGFDDRAPRYELVTGDTLNLRFQFTPELNQNAVAVQPDGYVSLQGIGDLHIAGKTLPEATAALQQAYAKILNR